MREHKMIKLEFTESTKSAHIESQKVIVSRELEAPTIDEYVDLFNAFLKASGFVSEVAIKCGDE